MGNASSSLLPLAVTTPHPANTSYARSAAASPHFDPPGAEPGGMSVDSAIRGPAASTGHLMPTPLRDRMRGEDIGNGWIAHTLPHHDKNYYYNRKLNLLTMEDMKNDETRSTFLSNYRDIAVKNGLLETVVYENKVHVVNHVTQTWDNHERRSSYWIYLSNFPCHHHLPDSAEKDALNVLQLMMIRNLVHSGGVPNAPFSMPNIKSYIDFFKFSKTLEASQNDIPSAKCFVVSNIIANFYRFHAVNTTRDRTNQWTTITTLACWGMPPNYLRRFDAASDMYGQTLNTDAWKSFLDVVRQERVAANVLSGLLLASSVAFLAIQNLVDVAQFFIIISIGLSLGCVVMGFNGGLDEKLSELEFIKLPNPRDPHGNQHVTEVGQALDQHYTMLLISVLCFYLALLVFTAYSIYASVFVAKSFTVPYAFYAAATGSLLIALVFILRWNRQFSH